MQHSVKSKTFFFILVQVTCKNIVDQKKSLDPSSCKESSGGGGGGGYLG